MKHGLFPPRDRAGRPRRFHSHREAASWSAQVVARLGLKGLPGGILAAAIIFGWQILSSEASFDPIGVVAVMVLLLALWLLGSTLLYLYTALSGGVMSRDERRRELLQKR